MPTAGNLRQVLSQQNLPNLKSPIARPSSSDRLTGAVEILLCLSVTAVGSLLFVVGYLTVNGAVILCIGLLLTLILLSWKRFDQGRHPCFLFLCTLTLFQGGRLLTYCLGYLPDPMRAGSFARIAFDLNRDDAGIVLLCLALSAICIYAPCRWNYQFFASPSTAPGKPYLPYLYLVFVVSLPLQFWKAYAYYNDVQAHGGYNYFFYNHAAVASSVPVLVRAASLLTLPVFVAIFVLEPRRKLVYTTAILYFISTAFVLLLGLRGGLFSLALVLWYVAGLKSRKRTSIAKVVVLAIVLIVVADIVQILREDSSGLTTYTFAPIKFVMLQGNSLEVTETAVKYRQVFAPYSFSYLYHELENAFIPSDVSNYARGKSLVYDVPVFLDRRAFSAGHGTASSYLAEAYVLGGTAGVVFISLLVGTGLHYLYDLSRNALSLVMVSMILQDVLIMPRGNLLDWLSVLLKNLLLLGILYIGWLVVRVVVWLKKTPRAQCANLLDSAPNASSAVT